MGLRDLRRANFIFTHAFVRHASNACVHYERRSVNMRKSSTVIVTTLALALTFSGAALAAVTHVSGQGISYDPGIALEDARADAVAKCTSQGGEPIEEVYNHLTRANQWIASSIWSCEVPDA
jgi:hypothetical protein